jgi:uncharacterized protein DUF6152
MELKSRWRCGVITRRHILALGAAGVLAAASPSFAHHSWPVNFGKEVTVKGTVTSYDWTNPHVMMGLDVVDASGKVEKWRVGGPATNRMAANGWDKTTLKPGDVITAMGYQFTDGSAVLRLQKIVMANGKEMFLYGK